MNKRTSSLSVKLRKSKVALGATALFFVVLLVGILELTNTTHVFHKASTPAVIPVIPTSSSPSSTSSDNQTAQSSTSSSKSSTKATQAGSSTPTSSSPLINPYGNFVSNHMPGANNTPTDEVSVCITTPGAKCYIKFTKSDGTSSQLPTQTVGSDGSTSWSWNANILTAGNWTVTAVATLNGQTKITQDPTPLSVK